MQIEQIETHRLVPYARNSRTHSAEQVAQIVASIREFGFTNPVLIDDKNMIVAGHGRVMAASSMGMEKVPCIRLTGLNEAQIKAYVIADNQLALGAGWDAEILKLELADLSEMNFKLDLLGFDPDELLKLLPMPEQAEPLCDEDDVPPVPEAAVSRNGDVWLMGNHRLMCGDSTEAGSWSVVMGGACADLIVTDPPYGVSYADKNKFLNAFDKGNRVQTNIENDHGKIEDIAKVWKAVFDCLYTIARRGCSVYATAPQGGDQMMMMMQASFPVRHELIWLKNNHVLGRADYAYKHEPILYSWKDAGHKFYGGFQTSIFEFPKPVKNDLHPTMKPVGLFQKLIENSSLPGEIVVDAFTGSGTTLIACEQTGRVFRGMELAPVYADVIVRRWQNFTGKTAILESTGEPFPCT